MCEDGNFDERILVWKIKMDGAYIIQTSMEEVIAVLESDFNDDETAEGTKITITRIMMSRKKFESLPEFEGW